MIALSALFASRFGKAGLIAVLAMGLAATCMIGGWQALATLRSVIETSVHAERQARDLYWRNEIATAHRQVLEARILQASAAMELERQIAALRVLDDQARLEMEASNANLPDGAGCGLDAARVRLVDKS